MEEQVDDVVVEEELLNVITFLMELIFFLLFERSLALAPIKGIII